ncbi:septation protein IspZ [Phenylobacterium sp. LjRoot225]|uniref:inner membrane-spanning protein YciB n=1 Tax=Phenylobacterium sp. LjRoot225 TaxID=3342285 RepID=UPI003ED10CD8
MSEQGRKWVTWFVDYFALAAWLIGYFISGKDLQQATWALVGGSAIALVVGFAVERRLAPFPAIAGGAALVFGGLTLAFHDARFLKVKPTVMNLIFAVLMFGGLILRKHPLKLLLGEAFEMPDDAWRKLTLRYGIFFAALAGLNEVVWRTQSEQTWVLFRFPGLVLITLVFSVAQAPLLMKYMKGDELPPPPVE